MLPFHYHIKFELYPSQDPQAPLAALDGTAPDIWLPTTGSTIFDDLPSHPRIPRPNAYEPSSDSGKLGVAARPAVGDSRRNTASQSQRPGRSRLPSFPAPKFTASLGPETAERDWRFGRISIESFDFPAAGTSSIAAEAGASGRMAYATAAAHGEASTDGVTPAASLGPTFGGAGHATRARYSPLETKNTEAGWGIVHLYREGDSGNKEDSDANEAAMGKAKGPVVERANGGDDGTILCIPAVPHYFSPSEFLGFVGEKWREDVSHYRMVFTSRMNRYIVLMKFRDRKRAEIWRKEFDGKVFNSVESEICHVAFIKSITVDAMAMHQAQNQLQESSSSGRPFPPPTADLVELPTCPVCLERMDNTTGLMTILCQHVFHCTCLQTWKGSGCPVCRATNPSLVMAASSPTQVSSSAAAALAASSDPFSTPFGSGAVSNLCSVCDCTEDLWICLICGNVGCGRYKGAHAKEHWKETAHTFSLELETQYVWDYAGDTWVHRLIREKGGGKVFELPDQDQRRRDGGDRRGDNNGEGYDEEDLVPRAKLDHIGLEYTHLLTSQLESQRVYFEELVHKAVDKASKASAAAEAASQHAMEATRQLAELRVSHTQLQKETVPTLEKDLEREKKRAEKASDLARSLGKSLQEEKRLGEGLMARIEHVNRETEGMRLEVDKFKAETEELRETNRDLTMFISGQEKVRELEAEGSLQPGELAGGTMSVPEEKKGKGKGKRGKK